MNEYFPPSPASELDVLEPERYEFCAPPTYQFGWSRREFFKVVGYKIGRTC